MQNESIVSNLTQELKRGTLVIAVLMCTDEPGYGYALIKRLQSRGFDIEQNTLYPLLRRLEKQGLLQSSWNTEESRPRRYYKISPQGRTTRKALLEEWKNLNLSIESMHSSNGDSER